MKAEVILPLVGFVGTLADHITTQIGLRTQGIAELNPLMNPIMEGTLAIGAPILVMSVGRKLGVSRRLILPLALIPASIPMVVAIRNAIMIITINARQYPLKEFPLLYPE